MADVALRFTGSLFSSYICNFPGLLFQVHTSHKHLMNSEEMTGGRYFESQTPHFFKIILSDALQNRRLGIPKKFVWKYGSKLSDSLCLQVASGDAWEVGLVRRDGGVWLQRGWPDFVKHYAIEQGHFLVFKYEGGSTFRVVIFAKSASEIEYPIISELPKREENGGDTVLEVFEDHSSRSRRNQREELPSSTLLSPSSKKRKIPNERLNKQTAAGGASNIFCGVHASLRSGYWRRCHPFRGSDKSEALERAAAFQSPNPFFLAFMQPTHIRHTMKAPAKFFMEYIPSYRSGGDIDLSVSDERFWSVRYIFGIYSRKPQVNINGGWKLFVQDNNLKVGDVCVFELTRKVDQVSFRVVIFRANQDVIKNGNQLKLGTSSAKPDESEYGKVKNEESASCDQSAGNILKVETAMEMFTLPKACIDGGGEGTGGTISPTGITSIETASKFRTNRPSFQVVICPKHLRRSTPNVPAGFVRRYLEHSHIKGTLRVGHRAWPIKLCVYPQPNFNSFKGKISAGWFNFARDNVLQVGDICIFELFNPDLIVLKVSIFGYSIDRATPMTMTN